MYIGKLHETSLRQELPQENHSILGSLLSNQQWMQQYEPRISDYVSYQSHYPY